MIQKSVGKRVYVFDSERFGKDWFRYFMSIESIALVSTAAAFILLISSGQYAASDIQHISWWDYVCYTSLISFLISPFVMYLLERDAWGKSLYYGIARK